MPSPVTLPRLSWGDPRAEHHALLVHGLGSSGALMWRYAVALADAGWRVDAVDLRGHGAAPRTLDYGIDAYAADLRHTGPSDDEPWDLVLGHSLGGAAATVASADTPAWTRHLVLVDPAIHLADADRDVVRASQEQAFADTSATAVRAAHPDWLDLDVELKAVAAAQASRYAVEQTSEQNTPWDVRDAASRLSVPTHVIGGDPAVYSIFTGGLAEEVRRNPVVTMSVVPGTGHSPHRDDPDAAAAALLHTLTTWGLPS
ncbi:alpha/beta hydrolase [Microbacterium sp. EYE_5]|uniref:alpha/beta fold hydrolase n=1 Tax=unclassified Microbacterium TaxID=2609290 RepID=UPI002006700E|nr:MULTISPECIES: alpha/beta hydrolase [unclassified Microbacterium]MCK6081202.1 alpha/beta hydrolase [Microbacterium sp. EYE_382]MCK6086472.1 alpha/beta hydrolase [Microbacterium sp. EYE_384]MCK6124030.1 alpha/beta hydrolase [Microbacterium sp. EYE_80]MCK6126939.1 alpha/beta hydrolase [Microbacterium sp. EYE_79]MCK6142157.1 alpha/beta hydrolase [Microbacterium sp. EYE_39]